LHGGRIDIAVPDNVGKKGVHIRRRKKGESTDLQGGELTKGEEAAAGARQERGLFQSEKRTETRAPNPCQERRSVTQNPKKKKHYTRRRSCKGWFCGQASFRLKGKEGCLQRRGVGKRILKEGRANILAGDANVLYRSPSN